MSDKILSADAQRILGSKTFASLLAFGNFTFQVDGTTVSCDGLQGLSGVVAGEDVTYVDGKPQIRLERILTHFHGPDLLIQQNPARENWGTLTGLREGGVEALLPGTVTFYQHVIVTANGQVLANEEPIVNTAKLVEAWPPIGSWFFAENPVEFFDYRETQVGADATGRTPLVVLSGCGTMGTEEMIIPTSFRGGETLHGVTPSTVEDLIGTPA